MLNESYSLDSSMDRFMKLEPQCAWGSFHGVGALCGGVLGLLTKGLFPATLVTFIVTFAMILAL
jgi:hypothetical protein